MKNYEISFYYQGYKFRDVVRANSAEDAKDWFEYYDSDNKVICVTETDEKESFTAPEDWREQRQAKWDEMRKNAHETTPEEEAAMIEELYEGLECDDVRNSLKDLDPAYYHKTSKNEYQVPEELRDLCYWFADSGYCILGVPKCFENEGAMWDYEVPIPAKYVLEKGWKKYGDYIIVDVPYDDETGLVVDEKYDEY